jgi:hypothetical protein
VSEQTVGPPRPPVAPDWSDAFTARRRAYEAYRALWEYGPWTRREAHRIVWELTGHDRFSDMTAGQCRDLVARLIVLGLV